MASLGGNVRGLLVLSPPTSSFAFLKSAFIHVHSKHETGLAVLFVENT